MNLVRRFLTENDCYKANAKMKPQGIMVHSTATPGVKNDGWFKAWNKSGISKCVHAFVDSESVMQTLPWDTVGWHSGVGSKGKSQNANNTGFIGFEICEPAGHGYSGGTMTNYSTEKNQSYFDAVYSASVELCAYLCKEFNISTDKIICHSEGHSLGIASNHSDVMQWFPKHNKSMDTFRADVKNLLNGEVKMRRFKLKEEMNFRKTPNGEKIGAIPEGAVVSGTVLEENRGILWLKTTYNGKEGFVAVLPESKNYAQEIFEADDSVLKQELEEYKAKCAELEEKIEQIKAILK
ncbi:MAG: N-acetylmuramoyl-L-alanine amidase [Clostridia bacterium]|nr:N-acetylmuramoyl-L-alanine amidase [Clostridia bacterium]